MTGGEVRSHTFPKWGPRGPFRVYSWTQAAVTVLGVTVACGLMVGEIWGPPLVLLGTLAVLAWRDRTGVPWWNRIGLGLRWLVRGWTGRRVWSSDGGGVLSLLAGVEVWGYDAGPGVMGMIGDRGRFLAAVRLSPVRDPWLMSPADRDASADDWARMVTSIPTETIDRLQVLTVVRTGGGDELLADAARASAPGLEVVKEIAGFVAEHVRHTDTIMVVRLTHQAGRDAEKHGGRDAVGRLLYSALQHLGSQVPPESLEVEILAPSELTTLFSQVLDPEAWRLGAHDLTGAEGPGVVGDVVEGWSTVRVGRSVHRLLWVWQWPQRRMAAGFLGPLLTGQGRRIVSILVEPADSESHAQSLDFAFRRAETAVVTAKGAKHRKQSEMEALDRQLTEINEGHVPVRVLATVAVSASVGDVDGLEDTTGTVRANAVAGACKVAPVSGNQLRALGRVLPLCRGLDRGLDS